jgi:hypothetical protein
MQQQNIEVSWCIVFGVVSRQLDDFACYDLHLLMHARRSMFYGEMVLTSR